MVLKKSIKTIAGMLFLLALSSLLVSCQGSFLSKDPIVIPKKQTIPLSEGVREGVWQAPELQISYRILPGSSGTIPLTGEIVFSSWVRTGFSTIQKLFLKALFLNESRNIIGSQGIYVVSARQNTDQLMRFDRQLMAPPGTVFLSFSYDGTMADTIKDAPAGWNFWYP